MCDNVIFYNNSQRDPIRFGARKIKCSWMHFLKIHFLRCVNAVGCVKKRHAPRCIRKMQAILSVLHCGVDVFHYNGVSCMVRTLHFGVDVFHYNGVSCMVRTLHCGVDVFHYSQASCHTCGSHDYFCQPAGNSYYPGRL